MTPSPADHYYKRGSFDENETTERGEFSPMSPIRFDGSPVKESSQKKTLKSFRRNLKSSNIKTNLKVSFP